MWKLMVTSVFTVFAINKNEGMYIYYDTNDSRHPWIGSYFGINWSWNSLQSRFDHYFLISFGKSTLGNANDSIKPWPTLNGQHWDLIRDRSDWPWLHVDFLSCHDFFFGSTFFLHSKLSRDLNVRTTNWNYFLTQLDTAIIGQINGLIFMELSRGCVTASGYITSYEYLCVSYTWNMTNF